MIVVLHIRYTNANLSIQGDLKLGSRSMEHKKTIFNGNILMIGCGAVAQCTLPLILKHLEIDPKKITILDMLDNRKNIQEELKRGINYHVQKITAGNFAATVEKYVKSGDLIIDLAFDIECKDILTWCHTNNVLYINTSVEEWDPYSQAQTQSPVDRTLNRTLYARHMELRAMIAPWKSNPGPTAILDHGANPGLVSHFVKQALLDIAQKIITEKPQDPRVKELKEYCASNNFAKIAQTVGVKVIHISERDTQITTQPKQVNEFVNTWSIDGFYEEGTAPSEMGWGTHEKTLPRYAYEHKTGPKNQICIAQPGIQTWVRSWVPSGDIIGMAIRHGESFTISDKLTVWENNTAVYRPTVHYAYCPSDSALNSLHELTMRNYVMQEKKRIMRDDILSGADEVGVLLLGHDFTGWWCGSILDIEETRRLAPHQNATTLQVAASLIAALTWMINNPKKGVCIPDDLPHDEILPVAKPYLGKIISMPTDWTPLRDRKNLFSGTGAPDPKPEDVWQFSTFLFE